MSRPTLTRAAAVRLGRRIPAVTRQSPPVFRAGPPTRPGAVVLPYPPSVNAYWRSVNGRAMLSRAARAYKTAVAVMVASHKAAGVGEYVASGPVVLSVDVYRPRKAGDLDNVFKALADGIRGFLFADDSQVVEIHARRFDDPANPRVEVVVTPYRAATAGEQP